MATLTAASTVRENNGSLTLFKFAFSSVTTTGDTFSSGLQTGQTVGYWAVVTSGVPNAATGTISVTTTIDTSSSAAISSGTTTLTVNSASGVNVSESGGTFTITPGGNAVPVNLFVWAKA